MIRLSLPLSQFFDVFRLDDPNVPQAIDDRIYIVHDDALDRELVDQDVEEVTLAIPGADTHGEQAFSFDEDHYVLAASVRVTGIGNIDVSPALFARPFGQAHYVLLQAWALGSTSIVPPGAAGVVQMMTENPNFGNRLQWPVFGRRETDYFFTASTGAGGGATMVLSIYRCKAVAGVPIAR